MIEDLFIAACVLFIAYNCCIFQMGWVANAAIWIEKNGGNKSSFDKTEYKATPRD